jgi:UDP-4-amino-4,6-dideoxy-N-acetyl-beta-L-altrosamine N-acetyltransferase
MLVTKQVEVDMSKASLRMIELDDIQLLRYWRNLDHVRNRMVMTNFIERDGQRKWFEGLNNDLVRYFIFSLDSKDIGCVNLTKINYVEKTFEGGVFCGDSSYLNHWVNIWACVSLYNYAFFELGLEKSYATILKDNRPALSLNKSLGYKFIEDAEQNIGRFVLTRNDYVSASEKIQRYLTDFAKQVI